MELMSIGKFAKITLNVNNDFDKLINRTKQLIDEVKNNVSSEESKA